MALTMEYVEKIVVANGSPENIIVSDDDFSSIQSVCRSTNRDETSVFVLVTNTKIRPKTTSLVKTVDVSDTELFA